MKELYLLPILAHYYDIIVDIGVGVPGHGRDIFDDLNTTDKRFISMLNKILQLPGSQGYDYQMEVCTTKNKEDTIISK